MSSLCSLRALSPALVAAMFALSTPAGGQASDEVAFPSPDGGSPSDFASENAILDTAIPFAIGAREAQQSLRSAFGWPTFQEGLVKGIYFRFDPDGYARFAPTPRLDTDVFEVVCRPRTLVCMGRKGSLSMTLNQRGQIQIGLSTAQEGDRFFLVSGISEFELPTQILQPLTRELELLLQSDGDIVIRRGENEVDRVSLAGVGVAAAYLRWVSAHQDYIVLPADWPVPNARTASNDNSITRAQTWQSPMPQPQRAPIQNGYAIAAAPSPNMSALESQIAQLQAQLTDLQGGGSGATMVPQPAQLPLTASQMQPLSPTPWTENAAPQMGANSFAGLTVGMGLQTPTMTEPGYAMSSAPGMTQNIDLGDLLRRIEALEVAVLGTVPRGPNSSSGQPAQPVGSDPGVAEKLDYMIRVIGMEPDEALRALNRTRSGSVQPTTSTRMPENAVLDVLRELETGDTGASDGIGGTAYESTAYGSDEGDDDYLLLSDYVNSVIRDR